MRKADFQAERRVRSGASKIHYLNWANLLQQPLVVVPWTLVFGIGEKGVLQGGEIFFDLVDWDNIAGMETESIVIFELRQQLRPIVPSRVIGKVLLDQVEGHLAFFVHEGTLVFLPDVKLAYAFLFGFDAIADLSKEGFDNPQPIIPAVKVTLVHFEHLVAEHKLVLQDLRLRIILHDYTFEHESFLDGPLSLEPKGVALGALHDAFDKELELLRDLI